MNKYTSKYTGASLDSTLDEVSKKLNTSGGTLTGDLIVGNNKRLKVSDEISTGGASDAYVEFMANGQVKLHDSNGTNTFKNLSDIGSGGGNVTLAGDNTFIGSNTFAKNVTFGDMHAYTRNAVSTYGAIEFFNGNYSCGQLVTDNENNEKSLTYKYYNAVLKFPKATGTLAITSDLPEANPTAAGTVTLTKLKIGDTVYNLPSGGGSGVTSVTTSGTGNAVTSASISGNTLTLTKGSTFLTSHQSLADCAKLSGNNTFAGNNTFNKGITSKGSILIPLDNAESHHIGIGDYTGISTGGWGAFLSMDSDQNGNLTLYSAANYAAVIRNRTGLDNFTYDLPDKSGTFALTSDVNTYIDKTIRGIISPSTTVSFTADEMTQIYNNYDKTIIHLISNERGSTKPVEKFLYPYGKAQETNLFIFVSPRYNNTGYMLTVSGNAGAVATATIEIVTFSVGDVTAAGNNTFSGSNSFAQRVTFVQGITNRSFTIMSPMGSADPTDAAPYAIYGYGAITLKASGVTGSDKVRTLNFPTSASGTLALTSDIKISAASLDGDTLSLTLA